MGVPISVLDPSTPAPAAVAAHQTIGSFADADAIEAFVRDRKIDVLTVEIEHVNVDAIEAVQSRYGVMVRCTALCKLSAICTLRRCMDTKEALLSAVDAVLHCMNAVVLDLYKRAT
jgi:phosphoribosylaminoimidazole carboxylase (NCAIR synthetase)